MTQKNRGETIFFKDIVQLIAIFNDTSGDPIDTDSFPQITITDPTGNIVVGPTSSGIEKMSTGKYRYLYTVGFNTAVGVWQDNWVSTIQGFRVQGSFNFIVSNTDLPALDSLDGYYHLGSEIPFDYDQTSIININKLLKGLRSRLNSRGTIKQKDAYGNDVYVTCDIFSVEQLVTFLATALTEFNVIPHWTSFTFADTTFISQFYSILVEGALIQALFAQALLERGREATISDGTLNFQPPAISELLNSEATALHQSWQEKLKMIKNTFKPMPIGLGSYPMTGNSARMNILALRRQGRIW